MNKILKNWYHISVYIGAIFALIAVLGEWDFRMKTLLIATTFIFLHFYEEFAFPGGFPWCGLYAEMHITDTDARNWPLNLPNTMFGNWWFAIAVYMLPMAFPNIPFLTLAVVLFAFLEVFMHLAFFNIRLKDWYNPGLFTAIFGLLPISIHYLVTVWSAHLYSGKDILLALIWIVFHYWIAFRSPIYKKLGSLGENYAFSEEEVWRAKRYIQKCTQRQDTKNENARKEQQK